MFSLLTSSTRLSKDECVSHREVPADLAASMLSRRIITSAVCRSMEEVVTAIDAKHQIKSLALSDLIRRISPALGRRSIPFAWHHLVGRVYERISPSERCDSSCSVFHRSFVSSEAVAVIPFSLALQKSHAKMAPAINFDDSLARECLASSEALLLAAGPVRFSFATLFSMAWIGPPCASIEVPPPISILCLLPHLPPSSLDSGFARARL